MHFLEKKLFELIYDAVRVVANEDAVVFNRRGKILIDRIQLVFAALCDFRAGLFQLLQLFLSCFTNLHQLRVLGGEFIDFERQRRFLLNEVLQFGDAFLQAFVFECRNFRGQCAVECAVDFLQFRERRQNVVATGRSVWTSNRARTASRIH